MFGTSVPDETCEKQKAAGVPNDYPCLPDMIHGPVSMAGVVVVGKALINQTETALRNAFAQGEIESA